jgi:hypothetical protein
VAANAVEMSEPAGLDGRVTSASSVQAILFDMDGVLCDSEELSRR